jgi:hypothetical protein
METETDWKATAEALWGLLDNIDTLDDFASRYPNADEIFRREAREVVKKRQQYMHSPDGQRLVVTR